MKKIDIPFSFRGQQYDALIRVIKKGGGREFHITVLNWDLERMLYGNEVIEEIEGVMHANVLPEKKEQSELKLVIASALSNYLNVPCFTGDACLAVHADREGWEYLHPNSRQGY